MAPKGHCGVNTTCTNCLRKRAGSTAPLAFGSSNIIAANCKLLSYPHPLISDNDTSCSVFKAKPNAGHVALAKFTLPLYREDVAPGSTFTLITQNVDELSRRALEQVKASVPPEKIGDSLSDPEHPPLIEMHGSLFDLECTAYECKHLETNYNSPVCPALAGTELIYEVGSKEPEPDIPKEKLPRCSKCGSLQRPGMVWFGEIPKRVDEVMKLTEKADLILVVGTSSVVSTA